MPETPTSCSASFTSSSLNGLMIASIFFTYASARDMETIFNNRARSTGARSDGFVPVDRPEAVAIHGIQRALPKKWAASLLPRRR
jgi:hypothetical protein